MIGFTSFRTLLEAAEASGDAHLKHLHHAEENVFHPNAFDHTHKSLENMHHQLKHGEKAENMHVSTKADGSPSVVYGHHPKTGKFFVGTKSVFNKEPKINYTHEDIDKNHGHAPGLAEKLKQSLEHLPKIMPKHGGVYQGDVMFGEHDKHHDKGGHIHFKPNTINYTVHKDHDKHEEIHKAKFGIATHTKYEGTPHHEGTLDGMHSTFNKDSIKLKSHKDVHQSNLEFNHKGSSYESHDKVKEHLDKAKEIHSGFHQGHLDAIHHHGPMFKTYVNSKIREGKSDTSIKDYHDYAHAKLTKEVDKMKSEKGKEKKEAIKTDFINHIKEHKETLHKALQVHDHIQKAKDHIVHAMNTATHEYGHSVNGEKTQPEGYVAVHHGVPVKLVHRHEFSKLNFDNSANRK